MDFRRVAGVGGLLFGSLVLVGNTFLVVPAKPLGGARMDAIVSYYVEHGSSVQLFSYVAPFAWTAIVMFAAGVVISTRLEGRVNGWAVAGLGAIATMIATFCGVVTADLVLATRADALADNPQYAQLLWDYHMVLQILNLTFVAIALGSFGIAAVTSGTASRLGKLALLGSALLLPAATQTGPGMTGSGPTLIALPGFAIWLIFVLGYSVIMIRMSGSDVEAGSIPTIGLADASAE
jgi:hypothetical protein